MPTALSFHREAGDHDGLLLRPLQPAIVAVTLPPLGFALPGPFVYPFQRMRHDLIDKRSLELNRLVAEKIRRQPELMDLVRGDCDRDLERARLSESCKDALAGMAGYPFHCIP